MFYRIEGDPQIPPRDLGIGGKEIIAQGQPVIYRTILGDKRLLFSGDDHQDFAIRDHIARHATGLRTAGITHYAIEAHTDRSTLEALVRLNQGEDVDLLGVSVGPVHSVAAKRNYEAAIKAIAATGITIIPIDIEDGRMDISEEREATLSQNLLAILEADGNTRVAVLIGEGHAQRSLGSFMQLTKGVKALGVRILEAGYPAVNITFVGGDRASDDAFVLNKLARVENIAQEEFMIKAKNADIGLSSLPWVDEDLMIHLPQNQMSMSERLARLRQA